MAKNTLNDLRDHLFEQLEKLHEAKPEDLDREIERSKAMGNIAGKILDGAKTQIKYMDATGQDATGSFFNAALSPDRLLSSKPNGHAKN